MIQLRPSEIRFWQKVHAKMAPLYGVEASEFADRAVEALRARLPMPDPNARDR